MFGFIGDFFDDVSDFVDDTIDDIGDWVDDAVDWVGDTADDIGEFVSDIDEWVEEEIFGAPSEEEIAAYEAEMLALQNREYPQYEGDDASSLRRQRKEDLAVANDDIVKEGLDYMAMLSDRSGTGVAKLGGVPRRMSSPRQKYKTFNAPLLGQNRPGQVY
jgi:hypothetical protein